MKGKSWKAPQSQRGEAIGETSCYLTCWEAWKKVVRFVNNLNWRSGDVLGHGQVFVGTIIVTHPVDAEVFQQWPVTWPIQHCHPIISLRKGQKQPCMTQHDPSLLFISVAFQCNQSFPVGWRFVHIAWIDVKIFANKKTKLHKMRCYLKIFEVHTLLPTDLWPCTSVTLDAFTTFSNKQM